MNIVNVIKTDRANIQNRVMLVNLSVSQWTARKLDRRVTADVAKQHNAKGDAGNYNKVLLARDNLAAIAQTVSEARAYHTHVSLPWLQDGARIMPVDTFGQYQTKMAKCRERFEREVNEFLQNYPTHVEQARERLGDMFNAADYPSAQAIAHRFGWNVCVLPLPDAADFRVDLDADTVAALRANLSADLDAALHTAVGDVAKRLHKVVSTMSEKLRAYDPTLGKQGNPFRDSLVDNVREIVEILPALNITGDARLSKAHEDAKAKLVARDAADLREDEALRNETAQAASEIADAMAGWMA